MNLRSLVSAALTTAMLAAPAQAFAEDTESPMASPWPATTQRVDVLRPHLALGPAALASPVQIPSPAGAMKDIRLTHGEKTAIIVTAIVVGALIVVGVFVVAGPGHHGPP